MQREMFKATKITTIFLDCLTIPYGIPSYHLTGNRRSLVGKILSKLYDFLGLEMQTITVCHFKNRRRCYRHMIVGRIQQYGAECQCS